MRYRNYASACCSLQSQVVCWQAVMAKHLTVIQKQALPMCISLQHIVPEGTLCLVMQTRWF